MRPFIFGAAALIAVQLVLPSSSIAYTDLSSLQPVEQENGSGLAVFQKSMRGFVTDMFEFDATDQSDIRARFDRAARRMSPKTRRNWVDWYAKWIERGKGAKAKSRVEVVNVFVTKKFPFISVRIPIRQTSTVFGKHSFEESVVNIRLTKYPEGYLVDTVFQRTPAREEGEKDGVFLVDSTAVRTESMLDASTTEKLIQENMTFDMPRNESGHFESGEPLPSSSGEITN